MTDQSAEREGAPASPAEQLRREAGVAPGQTLGIDNTDTALSPEETGYTPDQDPEAPPAGKGSDPPLGQLP